MATFHLQVEALTGIAIDGSSTPTETELSQFLKDGVMDVTNRWLAGHPQDMQLFARESAEQTSNTVSPLDLNGAKIISVVREDGVDNKWKNCNYISPAMQYEVTDVDSLNFASSSNPVYMIGDNGQINVFPAPGVNPNAFKVYYVNNDPEDKGGANLLHSHSDIKYFADDKVYLVVMYAAIRSLEILASSYGIEEDSELIQSYIGLTNSLKAEYNSAFMVPKQENR